MEGVKVMDSKEKLLPAKDGILWEIKKMLGIPEEEDCYDLILITSINSAFYALWQMGVGPDKLFSATNESMWDDFVSNGEIDPVKQYIYLKVKSSFDPPSTNALIDAYDRVLKEVEWRLYLQSDGRRDSIDESERLANSLWRVGNALGF